MAVKTQDVPTVSRAPGWTRGLKLRNADFLSQLHRSCPPQARGLKRVKAFHAVNGERRA
jgi:hypothetical protein